MFSEDGVPASYSGYGPNWMRSTVVEGEKGVGLERKLRSLLHRRRFLP
ncbi:hypothetical protein T4E_2365 [Trichinella pseudospiralis]|uniref:Uncharacterized protein n=1 Tax=Trichinella pseudospiralis TaxID=6337 RepID=A0A0V0WHC6_TRIPS|nr:hypothetical protein T4E_2365 [Trichinella pseudospiralis]